MDYKNKIIELIKNNDVTEDDLKNAAKRAARIVKKYNKLKNKKVNK